MDSLAFISSLVGSLAWPVAVFGLVVTLRRPLRKLLTSGRVKKLEAGPTGLKLEYFDSKMEEAQAEIEAGQAERSELDLPVEPPALTPVERATDDFMYEMRRLAEVAPSAAILESFSRLEKALREGVGDQASPDGRYRRPASARQLARRAVDQGVIAPSELSAFDDVAVLRNLVAHGQDADLDMRRAMNYVSIVRQLLISIALGLGGTAPPQAD